MIANVKSPFASPWYDSFHSGIPNLFNTLYSVRIDTDKMHWEKVSELMKKGADLLKTIENPSDELMRLENLGRYLHHCTKTVVNVHRWHKQRELLKVHTDKKEVEKSLQILREVAADERKNALDSIECLRKDSRLGFEPLDDYVGGEEAVMWKLKHLDFVVNNEINRYETELPL